MLGGIPGGAFQGIRGIKNKNKKFIAGVWRVFEIT
jgi:hypothetical protein